MATFNDAWTLNKDFDELAKREDPYKGAFEIRRSGESAKEAAKAYERAWVEAKMRRQGTLLHQRVGKERAEENNPFSWIGVFLEYKSKRMCLGGGSYSRQTINSTHGDDGSAGPTTALLVEDVRFGIEERRGRALNTLLAYYYENLVVAFGWQIFKSLATIVRKTYKAANCSWMFPSDDLEIPLFNTTKITSNFPLCGSFGLLTPPLYKQLLSLPGLSFKKFLSGAIFQGQADAVAAVLTTTTSSSASGMPLLSAKQVGEHLRDKLFEDAARLGSVSLFALLLDFVQIRLGDPTERNLALGMGWRYGVPEYRQKPLITVAIEDYSVGVVEYLCDMERIRNSNKETRFCKRSKGSDDVATTGGDIDDHLVNWSWVNPRREKLKQTPLMVAIQLGVAPRSPSQAHRLLALDMAEKLVKVGGASVIEQDADGKTPISLVVAATAQLFNTSAGKEQGTCSPIVTRRLEKLLAILLSRPEATPVVVAQIALSPTFSTKVKHARHATEEGPLLISICSETAKILLKNHGNISSLE